MSSALVDWLCVCLLVVVLGGDDSERGESVLILMSVDWRQEEINIKSCVKLPRSEYWLLVEVVVVNEVL